MNRIRQLSKLQRSAHFHTLLQRIFGLILGIVTIQMASGQDTKFAQTYTWLTESRGEHEVEVKMSRLDRNTWLSENEFETGVTDRLTLAPYLNWAFGRAMRSVGGWALEARYRFGDLRAKTLLPAVYLEPQQFAGDRAVTVETRLIGTYYTSEKFDTLISGNVIVTRLMERNEGANFGYAVGVVKMNSRDWFGAESFGSWTDKSHFLGPTFGLKLKTASALILNVGLSLSKQDNQLKVIYAHDF